MKRIKIIKSHKGLAIWLSKTSDEPIGYLARCQVEEIPSPYAYSPSKPIYTWGDKQVVWFETSHKHYEVFEVPAELLRFKTDEQATEWHMKYGIKAAFSSLPMRYSWAGR